MYAQYPDWGYFDHPPMIAWWVWLGGHLADMELAVRLLTVVAQPVGIYFLWKIVSRPEYSINTFLFFIGLAAVIPMLQVYGFIATPDAPLLFFTSGFLLAYHRFLEKENTSSVLALSICMAGMLYSKYHSGLFIALIILSNLKLLRNGKFWLAGILALGLFIPHVLWQIQNDFPSFKFHLVDRARPVRWKHILTYWPHQLLVFNPVILIAAAIIMIRFKPRSVFDRGLYLVITGFMVFFFLMAFRGHPEPHWTIAASLPLVLLLFKHANQHEVFKRNLVRWGFPFMILLLIARIALMAQWIPLDRKYEHREAWANRLAELADGRPVIFQNSYQDASLYRFYTRQPATSLSTIEYHQTQFTIWQFDTLFSGQPVLVNTTKKDPGAAVYPMPNDRNQYLRGMESFHTWEKVRIGINAYAIPLGQPEDSIKIEIELFNPYAIPLSLNEPVMIESIWFAPDIKIYPCRITSATRTIQPGKTVQLEILTVKPEFQHGNPPWGLGIREWPIKTMLNSEVKEPIQDPKE